MAQKIKTYNFYKKTFNKKKTNKNHIVFQKNTNKERKKFHKQN